jgi:cytochrome c553
MNARLLVMVAAAAILLGTSAAHAADNSRAVELIQKECSACHGPRGVSIAPTFPNLAGQQVVYLETQLRAFRDHSRADPHAQAFMWGMAAQLTDPTIKDIAAFFAAQPPAPGRSADPVEVAAGKRIFEQGIPEQTVPACQSCHGPTAAGNGPFPRLAGQHRRYLERQLEVFAVNLRANEIMHGTAQSLTALQISQLAAYLSSR